MTKRYLSILLCLFGIAVLAVSTGCGMFTPARNQRRIDVARADLARIPDEVDWILGFDEPSSLSESTFPPYRY